MTWHGDPRTSTPEWRRLRKKVLHQHHGICHVCGWGGADEVDHIDGNHRNNDPSNLAPIHDEPCHRLKSSREGVAARARLRTQRVRPAEPHPGVK